MCIILPPTPPTYVTIPKPAAPPAPAPLPPTTPGIPPSPPSPPPATVLDLVNSKVIATNGVGYTFQEILANSGLLLTASGPGDALNCTIRVVVQNNSSLATTAQLTITLLAVNAAELTPTSPMDVAIPANNYSTVNVLYAATGDGTVDVVVSIGGSSITLPIAFYRLLP